MLHSVNGVNNRDEIYLPTLWIQLTRVNHVGGGVIEITGWNYRHFRALTDLTVDNFCFENTDASLLLNFDFAFLNLGRDDTDKYILMECPQLQRLSMKGATWMHNFVWDRSRGTPEPIPQHMLIKMVRNHGALRWLRSDLTEQNVAMLQQERPEMTFVSE